MARMYRRPQRIWVLALLRQFGPAVAILEPGRACGMPYAPEYGFSAYLFEPLSRFHSQFRYGNCACDQPKEASIRRAICRGVSAVLVALAVLAAGVSRVARLTLRWEWAAVGRLAAGEPVVGRPTAGEPVVRRLMAGRAVLLAGADDAAAAAAAPRARAELAITVVSLTDSG